MKTVKNSLGVVNMNTENEMPHVTNKIGTCKFKYITRRIAQIMLSTLHKYPGKRIKYHYLNFSRTLSHEFHDATSYKHLFKTWFLSTSYELWVFNHKYAKNSFIGPLFCSCLIIIILVLHTVMELTMLTNGAYGRTV